MTRSRWQDPAWQESAHTWIDGRLGELDIRRTGAIEQPHVYEWSTVMRAPTEIGDVWFKANMEALRHEAALAEMLSTRRPDVVAPPLAVDRDSGWMLMPDAGRSLREVIAEEASLGRWPDVLGLYADLQASCADDVDAFLAVGVPDMRLATLPDKYRGLVEQVDVEPRFAAAVPYVADLCDQVAAFGLPETIQHDDLHDGQVFVRDGRHLVMDWGDACVSHPFFTLSVTLEGVISWGLDDEENSVDVAPFRDAYLAPFAARYDGDLAAAVEPALRLGWACRAVNGHVPGDDDRTRTRLRMFLDGRP
jgi:hypothetical protein